MQIKLFVPTHDEGILLNTLIRMTDAFNGATLYRQCIGGWINESNEIEFDEVCVIESFVNDEKTTWKTSIWNKRIEFENICLQLKQKLHQKCIAYTINDKIYLI